MSYKRVASPLIVDGPEGLREANDLLHDALFRFEDVRYDNHQGLLSLVLWRPVFELSRRRRVIPFLYRVDAPAVRCCLKVFSVKRALVHRSDQSYRGHSLLNEIRYDPRRERLYFSIMGPLKIELAVTDLRAELRDMGVPEWNAPSPSGLVLGFTP